MAIIEGYDWAVNRAKLERAINEVKESGKPVTDEAVKTVYVRLLGLVVESKPVKEEVEEVEEKKSSKKK